MKRLLNIPLMVVVCAALTATTTGCGSVQGDTPDDRTETSKLPSTQPLRFERHDATVKTDDPIKHRTQGTQRELPAGIEWDLRDFEKRFTILKSEYNAAEHRVEMLVEANYFSYWSPDFEPHFYDADDVELCYTDWFWVSFHPTLAMTEKGQRARVYVKLPDMDVLKKTRKIVFEDIYKDY